MSLQISHGDRILIVAPHPDDETIGCGGLMLKYGPQCDILLLTDGCKGYDSRFAMDEELLVKQRLQELRLVAARVGINQVYALGIPDGKFSENMERVSAFDFTHYQFVFVPNHYERHKDHAPVSKIVQKICHHQNASARIYEYEVWSPMPSFSNVLDIGDIMERKLEMVRLYQTQIRFLNYEAMTEALNRYRGVGLKMQYAEVYQFIPKLTLLKKVYYRIPKSVRNFLHKLRGVQW